MPQGSSRGYTATRTWKGRRLVAVDHGGEYIDIHCDGRTVATENVWDHDTDQRNPAYPFTRQTARRVLDLWIATDAEDYRQAGEI